MFKGMSKFQLIFTGVFAGFLVLGVAVFALNKAKSTQQAAHITIWGTMDSNEFSQILSSTGLATDRLTPVSYVQEDPSTFDDDFVNAIANGTPPDIVLISQEQLFKNLNKFYPIPYSSLSQRTFEDTYIEEADLFMGPQGVYAIPFLIDPYVMYWNRTIFQDAGLSQPPTEWDQFYDLARNLTKKDGALNITQSAVGMGEYSNVSHAKELLSTLMMQAGSPITQVDSSSGKITSAFDSSLSGADATLSPAEAAVDFYISFSDPTKDTYTWNRSLPDSKDMFISGDLATYFGPASELFDIQAKNPNLDFDVTYMPQSNTSNGKVTFGELDGLALVKSSRNIAAAYTVLSKLTGEDVEQTASQITSLPSPRRDLLASKPSSPYGVVFYNSALYAKGWADPDDAATDQIFSDLISSITSGAALPTPAISTASQKLQKLLDANFTPAPQPAASVPSAGL